MTPRGLTKDIFYLLKSYISKNKYQSTKLNSWIRLYFQKIQQSEVDSILRIWFFKIIFQKGTFPKTRINQQSWIRLHFPKIQLSEVDPILRTWNFYYFKKLHFKNRDESTDFISKKYSSPKWIQSSNPQNQILPINTCNPKTNGLFAVTKTIIFKIIT